MTIVDFARSAPFLLAVSFPFTRSASYPRAVSLARQSLHYREVFVSGRLVHLCGFAADRAGAAGALALLKFTGDSRGWRVASETGECPVWRAQRVLACYLAAPPGRGASDYCHVTCRGTDAVGRRGIVRIPCRLIKGEFQRGSASPSPIAARLHASAEKTGAALCPLWRSLWRDQVVPPR